jgi:hypothetical protein
MAMSKLVAAALLALTFTVPALAQEESTLAERNVYLFMNGKMVQMKAPESKHAMMMKEFKPLANGTMIYVSGGKLYMARDKKMSGGKMMSTEIFGRDFGIGSQS